MSGVSKIVAERNQRILLELVLKPGNDICADCKARAPRWASHNLGIFICVNCASIHRKMGTHISKVKSVTLDEWSKEQVEVMKEKGNVKSNALYNPNESRHPPPTNMIDLERDSELEKFIRAKYQFKRFMDRKSGATSQNPGANTRAVSSAPRVQTSPLTDSAPSGRRASPGPLPPPKMPQNIPQKLHPSAAIPSGSHSTPFPTRSASQPLPSDKLTLAPPLRQSTETRPSVQQPAGQVWEDLISLQAPSQSSSLPLQYSPATISSFPSQPHAALVQPTTPSTAPNPFVNTPLGQANATTQLFSSPTAVTPTQIPLASAPLSSPALHLGATNPFNLTTCAANMNPFIPSSMSASVPMSMPTSTPATSSMQPVMQLSNGPLQTPPVLYSQTSMSISTPTLPFSSTPFTLGTPPPVAMVPNTYGTQGQPIPAGTNPFSTVSVSPQTTYGAPVLVGQQRQQQPLGTTQGFVSWTGGA